MQHAYVRLELAHHVILKLSFCFMITMLRTLY
jgi:hypothetical protein